MKSISRLVYLLVLEMGSILYLVFDKIVNMLSYVEVFIIILCNMVETTRYSHDGYFIM